ncbi:MAG: hypothetical protein CMJ76_13650 [Planctomycetaceae bacterium]|nr:hypothetical protein [Planctomycetaceae bacterium]
MVAIFTRKLDDNLVSLTKKLQAQLYENSAKQLRCFVVYLTNQPADHEEQLAALAIKHRLRTLPLTIFAGKKGPPEIKLSPKAENTVIMWKGLEVKNNYAFEEGKMDANAIENVVLGLNTILE